MRIDVLNGIGFSRVTPDPNSQLGGFSRVNKSSTDTYLSGFRLNSTDSYILSGKAERQARREARKERREDRREDKAERKEKRQSRREMRQERKAGRKDSRARRREARTTKKERRARGEGGFIDKLLTTGKEVWQDLKPSLIEDLVPPQYQDLANDMLSSGMAGEDVRDNVLSYMEEDGYTEEGFEESAPGDQKGLFKKKSWWEKRSTGEKAAIIGGGVLALDLLMKGPISTNVLGMKKKKRK